MKIGFTAIGSDLGIFVQSGSYHFRLHLPYAAVRTAAGRAVVDSWLTGLVTIPGVTIPIAEVERLFDELDASFPLERTERRPRFRLL